MCREDVDEIFHSLDYLQKEKFILRIESIVL